MGLFKEKIPEEDLILDGKERRGIFVFFEVLFRKFFRFCNINLVFMLFALPFAAVLFMLSPIKASVIAGIMPQIIDIFNAGGEFNPMLFDVMLRLLFVCLFSCLFGMGPATCSIAYVFRNYARSEHAWIWSDSADAYKVNFFKGVIVFALDLASVWAFLNAAFYYSATYQKSANPMLLVCVGILIVVFAFYILMHGYIYQFIVTYDDKLARIYKNAALMTMTKLVPTAAVTLLSAAIVTALFSFLNLWAMIFMVFNGFSLFYFPTAFYTSRAISDMAAK